MNGLSAGKYAAEFEISLPNGGTIYASNGGGELLETEVGLMKGTGKLIRHIRLGADVDLGARPLTDLVDAAIHNMQRRMADLDDAPSKGKAIVNLVNMSAKEKIAAIIARKKNLMERVLKEDDPGLLKTFTRQDLVDILALPEDP